MSLRRGPKKPSLSLFIHGEHDLMVQQSRKWSKMSNHRVFWDPEKTIIIYVIISSTLYHPHFIKTMLNSGIPDLSPSGKKVFSFF